MISSTTKINHSSALEEAKRIIASRLLETQNLMLELKESNAQNSKSTAGDKHETGRAMVHLEMEKLSLQYENERKMMLDLSQIDPNKVGAIAGIGSLVFTDKGNYLIAISLGKFKVSDVEIYGISPQSPLAKALIGKKIGEICLVNGNEFRIKSY